MISSQPETLSILNLGKRYRHDFWGIRNFNLSLSNGITGLLGPNGAGKSTLMRMLATISKPSEGRIIWNGKDIHKSPNELRTVLGYLPQDFGVYPHLNAYEFLNYLAAIKGLPAKTAKIRIDELLTWVNLRDAAKRPLGSYSGGMRQRIGIAQALLNDPHLLIIDEPTVGLDPTERVRFRQLLSDLAKDRIILFSTHIVSDIEASANQIVIMNHGKVLNQNTPSGMMHSLDQMVWEMETNHHMIDKLRTKFLISSVTHRNNHLKGVCTEKCVNGSNWAPIFKANGKLVE
ncbi:MAG: ABC transporter ATP-binding protein, partial [Anaerolineaceae bacterium]|nr:ABC transporter ATP-binding protein [Anaerolineaceae bacterium]